MASRRRRRAGNKTHLIKEQKEEDGIRDNLLRLSVGIEDASDLISDLEQALK
ncbi:MAG: PLP-dependent transferase [Bacteroidales bacterium]|nr:PLP-dependent transferase [Bacteroidales bacterium]